MTVQELRGSVSLDDSAHAAGLRKVEADTRAAVRQCVKEWEYLGRQSAQATKTAAAEMEQAGRAAVREQIQLAKQWAAAEKEAAKLVSDAHKQAQKDAVQAARDAAKQQDQLARQAAAAHRQFAQDVRQSASAFSSVGTAAGSALSSIAGMFRSLIGDALSLARTIIGDLVRAFEQLAAAAIRAGEVIGGVLAAAFLFTAKSGVDMHVIIDRSTLALTRIGGSAEKAAALLADLKKEALTSALTFAQLIPIAQRLGASYGPEGFGKIIPTIRAFGDVSATLGASVEAQERALQALQHLIAAGPNLRSIRQLSFNLPGANVEKILVDQFGTSDSKALKAANVTGEMIADAIVAGFTARFGGSQVQLSHTLPIILSNFADAFNNVAQEVTNRFMPALTGALDQLLALFQQVAINKPLLEALAVPFDLVAAAIRGAATALPGFVGWLQQILTRQNVVDLLANIVGYVQALGDEVARFLGVVSGGKTLGDVFTVFRQAAETAIDAVLRGWNVLVASIRFVMDHSKELWGLFVDAMKPAQRALDILIGSLVTLAAMNLGGKVTSFLAPFIGGGTMQGGAVQGGLGGGSEGANSYHVQGPGKPATNWFEAIGMFLGITQGANPGLGPVGKGTLDTLEGIGKGTRGFVGDAANSLAGNIPERAKALWDEFLKTGEDAWRSGGLARFRDAASQHAAAARGAINAALGPAAAVGRAGASGIPPSEILFPGRGAAAGTGGGRVDESGLEDDEETMDAKTARKSLRYGNQVWAAQLEAVKARIEAFPQAQQAQQAVQQLIPMLQAEMADLMDSMPQVQKDTQEYWDRVRKYWGLEKEINELTGKLAEERDKETKKAVAAADKAVKEQAAAVKKAETEARRRTSDALQLSRAETSLIEARVKTLEMIYGPKSRLGARAVIPSLLQQFSRTGRAVAGETPIETRQRSLEQEGLGQRILEEAKKAGLNVRRVFAELVGLSLQEAGKPIDKNLARIGGLRLGAFQEDLRRINRMVNTGPGAAALAAGAPNGGNVNVTVNAAPDFEAMQRDPAFQKGLEETVARFLAQWRRSRQ